jgi:hypothetical protein
MKEPLQDYFIEQTNLRLERIEQKLDVLLEFKWTLIGGSVMASALVALAVQVLLSR